MHVCVWGGGVWGSKGRGGGLEGGGARACTCGCMFVCMHIYIIQVSGFTNTTSCAMDCAVDERWASFEL